MDPYVVYWLIIFVIAEIVYLYSFFGENKKSFLENWFFAKIVVMISALMVGFFIQLIGVTFSEFNCEPYSDCVYNPLYGLVVVGVVALIFLANFALGYALTKKESSSKRGQRK